MKSYLNLHHSVLTDRNWAKAEWLVFSFLLLNACRPLIAQDNMMSDQPKTGTNLFESLDGQATTAVDEKLTLAVNRFFGIGTGESASPNLNAGYRCYYELPQNPSAAFIWAADSNDIRSEGMSYGLMIAIQMDLKAQFDKLWNFAKTYMQYPATSPITAWRHYFRWQLTAINTTNASNWTWTTAANTTPAPDGDEYFAMALYLADRRWGSDGIYDYKAEADSISNAMLNNTASGSYFPIIHSVQDKICFCPVGAAYTFTDPSYHLPAFYECYAEWGPVANAARWRTVAQASRDFLVASAYSTTGLHSDYASYTGIPIKDIAGTIGTGLSGTAHDTFRYDAWRVVMNMAMDYAWWGIDERMKDQVEKYHSFFATYKGWNNVSNSLFGLNGTTASGGGSTALTATLAVGSLVSDHADATFWVDALWNIPQQSGQWRYYQECVYILGLINVAGKYLTTW